MLTSGRRMGSSIDRVIADQIIDEVAQAGVRHVFLIPGGGSMYLVDALGRHPKLEAIAMLHEQGASIAAEAYAQCSGNLGVLLVTTGPGGTNALTGVAAAFLDSTPLLVISGQVKTADSAIGTGLRQLGFQEIDIVEMARPVTKFSERVTRADDAVSVIRRAITVAKEGRPGPVWVDVPLDIQSSTSCVTDLAIPRTFSSGFSGSFPGVELVDRVISSLVASCRPVLLAGNGLRLAGAQSLLRDFLEAVRVPTLLTWKALDLLPFDHKLNAGRPGAIATRYANMAHQLCDFYLAIGARLDMGQTGYRPENIAPNAERFIVDVDESELRKLSVSGSTLIRCDAKEFMEAILQRVSDIPVSDWPDWLGQIDSWKEQFDLQREHLRGEILSTYDVIQILSDQMDPGDFFVPGSSGACSEVSMQAFRNKPGQRVFNSEGLGPMGFGIAAPIGSWFLNPHTNHYAVDGDGGFVMNIQELEVASRERMRIFWVVLDNGGYGSIQRSQDTYFNGRRVASDVGSGLTLPEIARVSKSFGVAAGEVDSREQLVEQIQRFKANPQPTVVVAKVDPAVTTSPRVFTVRGDDGSLRTSDLTDLVPRLNTVENNVR